MFSVCYITINTAQGAEVLAKHLVGQRLAACVNIISQVQSVYTWEGEVKMDQELLLMVKTRTSLVDDVIREVRSQHPYDTPEIISVEMGKGCPKYLSWVEKSTGV